MTKYDIEDDELIDMIRERDLEYVFNDEVVELYSCSDKQLEREYALRFSVRPYDHEELILKIYHTRRMGGDINSLLDELIDVAIGRM